MKHYRNRKPNIIGLKHTAAVAVKPYIDNLIFIKNYRSPLQGNHKELIYLNEQNINNNNNAEVKTIQSSQPIIKNKRGGTKTNHKFNITEEYIGNRNLPDIFANLIYAEYCRNQQQKNSK